MTLTAEQQDVIDVAEMEAFAEYRRGRNLGELSARASFAAGYAAAVRIPVTVEQIVAEADRHQWQILWGKDHIDTGGIQCSCGKWGTLEKDGIYRNHKALREHRLAAVHALGEAGQQR